MVLDYSINKQPSEHRILLILIRSHNSGKRFLLGNTLYGLYHKCADCIQIVIPKYRLILKGLEEILVDEYHILIYLAPEIAIGSEVGNREFHILLVYLGFHNSAEQRTHHRLIVDCHVASKSLHCGINVLISRNRLHKLILHKTQTRIAVSI